MRLTILPARRRCLARPIRAHGSTSSRAGDALTRAVPRMSRDPRAPRRGRVRRLVLITAVMALAVLAVSSSAYADPITVAQGQTVTGVLDNIRNWLMGILAGLATVFLSIGGVRYVMASGDPGEVEKAKTAFKSAGWGYGLAALAPLIVEILRGIVGA
jgi:type IV secretion system pilin